MPQGSFSRKRVLDVINIDLDAKRLSVNENKANDTVRPLFAWFNSRLTATSQCVVSKLKEKWFTFEWGGCDRCSGIVDENKKSIWFILLNHTCLQAGLQLTTQMHQINNTWSYMAITWNRCCNWLCFDTCIQQRHIYRHKHEWHQANT